MILKLYAMRDKASQSYGKLFTARADIDVQRDFFTVAQENPNSNPVQYGDDFDMHVLGTFNDTTGEFDLYKKPRTIFNCRITLETLSKLNRSEKQTDIIHEPERTQETR